MIPKEVLKKIRKIQITTSRMVTDLFAGQYHSVFKGRGMEFDEVREYMPGDDIQSIDWNVTARTGLPHIKKFVEERELTVMILLDASMSCKFGSSQQLKSQIAAELSSVLAFSATQNNDKIGLIVFTDRIEKFVPPHKGLKHVLRVIREALYFKPEGKGTDISLALEYLSRVIKRKAITFLISDFFDDDFKKRLSVTNKRHDVIAVTITDPREVDMPDVGLIKLNDAESGRERTIDTSNKSFRTSYTHSALERLQRRKELLRGAGIDNIDIYTNSSYTKELIRFFKMRRKRLA